MAIASADVDAVDSRGVPRVRSENINTPIFPIAIFFLDFKQKPKYFPLLFPNAANNPYICRRICGE